jgi:hypothetical protein
MMARGFINVVKDLLVGQMLSASLETPVESYRNRLNHSFPPEPLLFEVFRER